MGLFSAVGNLFSYQEPAPLSKEKKRRFELMGKSNRELNIILDRTPHLHCKKIKLVDLIMAREFDQL
jgi:hypothetical protein